MARSPAPVRPRRKDDRRYFDLLRRTVLLPLFGRLRDVLENTDSMPEVMRAVEAQRGLPADFPSRDQVAAYFYSLDEYHRARFVRTIRSALGVDIRGRMLEEPIRSFMRARIQENVDLIRTIPPRMHDSLKIRLEREFREAPFDRQRLTKVLSAEYRSTGYNLRRLARDQTSKAIGQFTEVRQRQIGVERYTWRTSEDERVRPTHIANNGRIFRWDDAPPETGHPGSDVQCRCVAIAIVPELEGTAA